MTAHPSLLIVAKAAPPSEKEDAFTFIDESRVFKQGRTSAFIEADYVLADDTKVALDDAAKKIPHPSKLSDKERHQQLLKFFDPTKLEKLKKPKTELKPSEQEIADSDFPGYIHLLNVWEASDADDRSRYGDWYEQANADCQKLAAKYNIPLEAAVAVVAGTSQGTLWEENIALAEFFLSEGTTAHPPGYTKVKITPENRKRVEAIRGGDYTTVLTSKFGPFFKSILDPMATKDLIVIDTHMIGIWYGKRIGVQGLVKPTNAMWASINRDISLAAQEVGRHPQDFQAITWSVWRKMPPGYNAERMADETGVHPEVQLMKDAYPSLYRGEEGEKQTKKTWRYKGKDIAPMSAEEWHRKVKELGPKLNKLYGINDKVWEHFLNMRPDWKKWLEEQKATAASYAEAAMLEFNISVLVDEHVS